MPVYKRGKYIEAGQKITERLMPKLDALELFETKLGVLREYSQEELEVLVDELGGHEDYHRWCQFSWVVNLVTEHAKLARFLAYYIKTEFRVVISTKEDSHD
jgi:hypothetical protein